MSTDGAWHDQWLNAGAVGPIRRPCTTRAPDLNVFYRGAANTLRITYVTASDSVWHTALGGSPADDPAAVFDAATQTMHAFFRAADGTTRDVS